MKSPGGIFPATSSEISIYIVGRCNFRNLSVRVSSMTESWSDGILGTCENPQAHFRSFRHVPGPGYRGSPHVAVARWSLPSHPWSHHSSAGNQGGGVDRLVVDHCDSSGDLTGDVPLSYVAAICRFRKSHSPGFCIRGFFHFALLAAQAYPKF